MRTGEYDEVVAGVMDDDVIKTQNSKLKTQLITHHSNSPLITHHSSLLKALWQR